MSTNEIQDITAAQFDNLKSKHLNTPNGGDLEINKGYTVTIGKMVYTQNGKSIVLTLLNNVEVWATDHLRHKLLNGDTYANTAFYLSPLGLKLC